MIPVVGDVLGGRYRLISEYRRSPGIEAWRIRDVVFNHDYQLFIICDGERVSKINAIASSLILSKDPHFSEVFHIIRDGNVLGIITDLDHGVTLADFVGKEQGEARHPLGYDVQRLICFNLLDAIKVFQQNNNDVNPVISPLSVRLTPSGITIADACISPILAPPFKILKPYSKNLEISAIMQIAALLFFMLTGKDFHSLKPLEAYSLLSRDEVEIPSDLRAICIRSLGLAPKNSENPVLPVMTFFELEALLGIQPSLSTKELLTQDGYTFPVTPAPPSITQLKLAPVDRGAVYTIPDSLFTHPLPIEEDDITWTQEDLFSNEDASYSDSSPLIEGFFDEDDVEEELEREKKKKSLRNRKKEKKHKKEPTTVSPDRPLTRDELAQSLRYAREEKRHQVNKIVMWVCIGILTFSVIWSLGSMGIFSYFGIGPRTPRWNVNVNATPLPSGQPNPDRNLPQKGNPSPVPQNDNQKKQNTTGKEKNSSQQKKPEVQKGVKYATAPPSPTAFPPNAKPLPIANISFIRRASGVTGYGLYIRLAHPATVQGISITTKNGGGQAAVYIDGTPQKPVNGSAASANFSFKNGTATIILLSQPKQASSLVIWVSQPVSGTFYFKDINVV